MSGPPYFFFTTELRKIKLCNYVFALVTDVPGSIY